MTFRSYIPSPPLSDFVELFWFLERPSSSYARERALPTGTVELVINLCGDRLRVFDRKNTELGFHEAMICGPHSEYFVIDSAQGEPVLGVHFKPSGAFPFLKLPAGELHNTHVSLETLWGAQAASLREQLLEAKTLTARFRFLEQFLLEQAAWPLSRHRAVAFALQEFRRAPHARTIADVAERIGISQRHFIQVFRDEVGMPPKLFCRVRRFQQVLRFIEKEQPFDWVEVALACGYYDQAHFINDFQAFSGLNPTAYLAHPKERNANHVPIIA